MEKNIVNEKEYNVQINSANGQPFVNLSKKDGFKKGDPVGVIPRTNAIYSEEYFNKYIDEEKNRFFEMFNKINNITQNLYKTDISKFILDYIPELLGLGKQANGSDEGLYYENSDFDVKIDDSPDGGIFGCVVHNIHKIHEDYTLKKEYLKSQKELKEHLEDYMKNLFISNLYSSMISGYENEISNTLKEYGFEFENENTYRNYFTNGKIKICIDYSENSKISLENYGSKNKNRYEIKDFKNKVYDIYESKY